MPCRRKQARRGLGTGSVLLVVLLLLTLGISASMVLLGHFRAFDRFQHAKTARNLADTAIYRMMSDLQAHPELGQSGQTQPTQTATAQGHEGARGYLTFDADQAAALGCPLSTNDMGQPPRPGYQNRMIPRDAIQLVGLGRSGGVERVVVATLMAPPFRDALTTSGPLEARGGVTVAGVAAFPSPGAGVAENDLRSASLLCNASGAQAVLLGSQTHVKGSVRSVGTVVQEPGAKVDEGIRQVEPYQPQALTLTDYDPALKGLTGGTNLTASAIDGMSMTGVVRSQGSLTVNGDLKLSNGLLYCPGDLTIDGDVQGHGLIVCTGKLRVRGTAGLADSTESGTGVALLAGGSVRLEGSGASGSVFKGLVYSGSGGIEASRITVQGNLVSAGSEPVVLEEARVLVPQNLPANVTWQGGSQAGPDPAVTHTEYSRNDVPIAPGPSWTTAFVYEKHEATPGNSSTAFYRRFTFAKSGGVVNPTPLLVEDIEAARLAVAVPDRETRDRLTNPRFPSTPDLGNPPPPPPADPQRPGPPGLAVGPSQFYSLARRLRVVLWQTS